MRTLGLILLNVISTTVSAVAGGFLLVCLWRWFVTATFVTLPALRVPNAVGLMIVFDFFLSSLTMSMTGVGEDTDFDELLVKSVAKDVLMIAVVYPLTWLGAAAWHQFVC